MMPSTKDYFMYLLGIGYIYISLDSYKLLCDAMIKAVDKNFLYHSWD